MSIEPRFPSVLAALLAHADGRPDDTAITLAGGRSEPVALSYEALVHNASRAAAALAESGASAGDRVLIALPTGPEFVTAFLGAQLLGAIPVATATPGGLGGKAGFTEKFGALLAYLRPAAIVSTADVVAGLAESATGAALLEGAALHARATAATAPEMPVRHPDPESIAFIQCTSGSTGTPKGVMISHANLAANCEQIVRFTAWGAADTFVSWLPLYHDFGLVCGTGVPIYAGTPTVLMPPDRFLRAPAEWLRLLTTHRGTMTSAPNFALGYCAARIRDTDLEGVDLSSLRMLFCGGEPVRPETVRRFTDRFAEWGLPARSVMNSYGMAEATLAVAAERPGAGLRHDTVARDALSARGEASDVAESDADGMPVTHCGIPMPGTGIRIVGDDDRPVADGTVGHVHFRGPGRTAGYFDLPEETAAAVTGDGWWRTGDMGYLRDGRLRITGRSKDMIIIRGANYFPTDFESIVEAVPGVRPGGVVAVGHRAAHEDSESLHLVVETDADGGEHERLGYAIRSTISHRTGVFAAGVRLVPRHSIPKTTSGKVQRSRTRQLFLGAES
ncbi:fatty acyl-AMP ligase [Nocardia mexicana]|uniref:Acyl-CoA synthetase (AMP-forming)/AMP-acid ligase II n=1 Tax=Nocardia mexicana TaxID=279262 RepID=A0A370GNI7_9NOCA|nr:fatty acyl-AMP ligase [Nocardia mexicana]RDI44940.1 acyl-CoA synthetase (AMP-forming)/AMP-acid ligase II [Nocardia mexicana]